MAIKTIMENISKTKARQKKMSDAVNMEEKRLEGLKKEVDNLKVEITGLKKETTDLTSKGGVIKKGNNVLLKEQSVLKQELSDKKDELKETRELLKKVEVEGEEKVKLAQAETKKHLKESVGEVVKRNKELGELSMGIKVGKGERDKLLKEKTELREFIKEKKMTLEWLVNEIGLRETEKHNLEEEIRELKSTEEDNKDIVSVLTTHNKTNREDGDKAKERLDKLEHQIELTKNILKEKEEEVESKKMTVLRLVKKERKIEELSKKIKNLYQKAGINITI